MYVLWQQQLHSFLSPSDIRGRPPTQLSFCLCEKLLRGNRIFWSFLAVRRVYFSPSVVPFITALSGLSRLGAQQLIEMTFPNTHTHTLPTLLWATSSYSHTHTEPYILQQWQKTFIRGYVNTVDSWCTSCFIFYYFPLLQRKERSSYYWNFWNFSLSFMPFWSHSETNIKSVLKCRFRQKSRE